MSVVLTEKQWAAYFHDLRLCAYHEAGHAVARLHLRLPFRYVTIDPDFAPDGSSGCIAGTGRTYRIDPGGRFSCHYRSNRYYVERHIISGYAGPEAERRYRRRRHVDPQTSAVDLAENAALALQLEGSEERARAFTDWLHLETRDLVGGCWWPEIKAVARALNRYEYLSAKEVKEVISADIARRSKRYRKTHHEAGGILPPEDKEDSL